MARRALCGLLVLAAAMGGPPAARTEPQTVKERAEAVPLRRLRLEPFGSGLPTRGQWRNGFDVGDLDRDGHADIVHGPPRKGGGQPIVFRGDGRGGFERWSEASFPELPFDYGDAATADFNRDGLPDLALAVHLRGLVTLAGDGRGGFRTWGGGPGLDPDARARFSSRAIEAADWNGDGRPDLIALGEGLSFASISGSRGLRIWLSSADGWRELDSGPPLEIFGDHLVTADFNGDGRTDVACASRRPSPEGVLVLQSANGGWRPAAAAALRRRAYSPAVAAADFDGDGIDDLAVAFLVREGETWRAGIDLVPGTDGDDWTREEIFSIAADVEISALAAGDLNGDGTPEIAAGSSTGELWILARTGGRFRPLEDPALRRAGEGCKTYSLRFADLDGRGGAELVAGFAGEQAMGPGRGGCPTGGSLRAWRAVRR